MTTDKQTIVKARYPDALVIVTHDEQNIKLLWTALQVTEGQVEKRGLQFGKAMYEYREKYKRPDGLRVSSETQNSFEEFCDRLSIPRATAYRWIAKYEESIGTRLPKSDLSKLNKLVKVGASSEVPITSPLNSQITNTTHVSPVSFEEKDKEQLTFLIKRLESIFEALQQVSNEPKWTKYDEYKEVITLGSKISGLVTVLRRANGG
jgi:hypothetical protein